MPVSFKLSTANRFNYPREYATRTASIVVSTPHTPSFEKMTVSDAVIYRHAELSNSSLSPDFTSAGREKLNFGLQRTFSDRAHLSAYSSTFDFTMPTKQPVSISGLGLGRI
jgi:hypothetical protein